MVLAAFLSLLLLAPSARAASGEVSISGINSPPQPSGAPSKYLVTFTCQATEDESCGEDAVLRIPLTVTSSLPETPDIATWAFTLDSEFIGLVEEWNIEGGELVVAIDSNLLEPGELYSFELAVTPPNGITPDGTAWEFLPSFETTEIEAEAPEAAPGEAKAEAKIAVSKDTHDGGSIYVVGNKIIYNITASCNANTPAGSLFLTEGALVDVLPSEAKFVSASPEPDVGPSPGDVGGALVWDFTDPGTMPPNCVDGAGGVNNYQVIVEIPAGTEDETVFTNNVTMYGTPIGDPETELETAAKKDVTVIDVPPVDPGDFLGKSAQGPLNIDGLGFYGTYPGHWMTPIRPMPSQFPGQAEGRYTVNVAYPASRAFETDLIDPVPCLENKVGAVKYASLAVEGDVEGAGSAPLCEEPAFHPTVVRVVSASMPEAIGGGWEIELITTGGEVVAVPQTNVSGTSSYFSVPDELLGEVAAVRLPPDPALTDRTMTMDVWGYADAATEGGQILEDIAAGTAYDKGSTEPVRTSRHAAELYIQPNLLQLAVHKSFGTYKAAPGGTTAINLIGGITIPPAYELPGPVVIADLLPEDMTWANPVSSATFGLTQSGATVGGGIEATVEHIADYEGLGRELVRISFDPEDFPGEGYYRLTPPSNFLTVEVPAEARVYNNAADAFASNSGRQTATACGAARNAEGSTFESSDPLDLDGDGEIEQNYCSFSAELRVPGSGNPGYGLTKQVQGALDPTPKGKGKIGHTTNGGEGEFTLTWRSTGGQPVADPVIYDILPYVGDTGTTAGQSGAQRGSEFQVELVEVSHLDEGVTVEYSESTNPCRGEVYPAAPGCVEDWATSAADPAAVRALRFKASGSFAPGDSFVTKFVVSLPLGEVNNVAWNSGATSAKASGDYQLPVEPPKVGITAPIDPVTPTLSTEVSAADVAPGTDVTDTITVGDSDDINGTVAWQLLGPVDVEDEADCDEVDWDGAAVADEGELAVTGSGEYETAPTTLTDFGCYGYVVTLDGPGYTGPVTSPAGSENEVVIVRRLPTNVSTQVSSADLSPAEEVTDTISIAGSEDREGEVEWQLLGPVEVGNATDCDEVEWDEADVYDEGSFTFTGDGDYETAPTVLGDFGCYGYVVTVGGGELGWSVTSPAGSENEVVIVRRLTPTISTQVSSDDLAPDAPVTDTITVGGTEGRESHVEWQLLGPVEVGDATDCDEVDWDGADVFDEGSFRLDGDGVYETAQTVLTELGCYAYVVIVGGEELGSYAESPPGSENEVVIVRRVQPTVSTHVLAAEIAPGATATDRVTIGGTEGRPGLIEWQLVGPVPMAPDWTCNGVGYDGAPVADKGTIATKGDGDYTTAPTALPEVGCYSYVVTIGGEKLGNSAVSPAGSPNEVVLVRHPAGVLALEKSANRGQVKIGQSIVYTLKVTNTGPGPAAGVRVTDTPETPMAFVSATPSQGACGAVWPLTCDLGTLPAGATATVKVVAKPLRAGGVSNSASVDSPDPKTPGSTDGEKSRAVVALQLSKRASAKALKPGQRLTYRIVVRNPSQAAARNAKVCDRPPAGIEVIRTSPKAQLRGGQYCWTIETIGAGKSRTLTVTARVLKGAKGRLVNVARLSGPQAASTRASAPVRVLGARTAPAGGVTG